jgi:hypothetical protein
MKKVKQESVSFWKPLQGGVRVASTRTPSEQKFFGSFFQKRTAVFLLLTLTPAQAQMRGQDPDWPCAQLLVPKLEPGSYWNGPVPAHTAWRDNDAIFALVPDIVNRDTPEDEAVTKLKAYVATLPPDQRAAQLPALFSAIVDETNDERTVLITRIKRLGARQRRMGDVVANISTQVDQMPANDPKRPDMVGERDFDIRAFGETQHTMRYACEAPAGLERRLGVFAKVLAEDLKK